MEDEKIVELYLNRAETAIDATNQKYGSYIFLFTITSDVGLPLFVGIVNQPN